MGGHVPVAVDAIDSLLPLHKSGKLRILATSGAKRTIPSIPTFKEAGVNISASGWNTLYAKSTMPAEKVERYANEIQIAMQSAKIREQFLAAKADPVSVNLALAGWPWCGYQFLEPHTGITQVRILGADQDSWASVVQTQAYFNAISARNPGVSIRIFRDAKHGFGYGNPAREFPEAMAALLAPIVYFNERGVALDLWSRDPMPGVDDNTLRAMLAQYITHVVSIGTQGHQMQDFMNDFTHFFRSSLLD